MAVTAACVMALTACGGGGGGDDPPPNPGADAGDDTNPPATPTITTVRDLSYQTEANGQYVVDATSAGTVELVLPASPPVGSTLSITGLGANDWRIVQNDGQYIVTTNLTGNPVPGADWTLTGPADRWWFADMSNNGNVIAVASNFALGGQGTLSVSQDRGATWTTGTTVANWSAIDMTPDGSAIVATAANGNIHLSTDLGASWTPLETTRFWLDVTISADGQRIAAVEQGGPIHLSTDGGATWTATGPSRGWEAIAGSDDGMRLVAVASDAPDGILVSGDGGVSWTSVPTHLGEWYRADASADGQRMVVAASGGDVMLSTDGGATWTSIFGPTPIHMVSMSADGQTIALAIPGSALQLSTDGGATFTPVQDPRNWRAVALSGDANVMLAGDNNMDGRLYLSYGNRTAVGEIGSVTAGTGDHIELEYLGNGRFVVRDASGEFVIQ